MFDKIRRLFSLVLVRSIWIHWFNPLYTLYFNLVFLPFRQAVRLPIFIYGWPRLYSQYGNIKCLDKCKTGMVRINISISGGPQYGVGNNELNIWGTIIFRGRCEIGTGSKIIVGNKAVLDLGDCTKIASFCNITSYTKISIGEQSWIAHRCQVLDTNFHYIADFNKGLVKRHTFPIEIGKYCWICNSTTVTGGSIIPDKTIVASNSLVNKDFSDIPTESIIGGIPAKYLSTGYRRIENCELENDINKFFNISLDTQYILPDNIDHECCDYK